MSNQQIKELLIKQYELNPLTTYVGIIDGDKSKNLESFMKEVSLVFQFPSYYSGNMNSFTEIMNDLSWLNVDDYILVIFKSNSFLKNESLSQQESIKGILVNLSKEWSNVPNYQGESEYRKKAHFIVHYM